MEGKEEVRKGLKGENKNGKKLKLRLKSLANEAIH
ncbi:MAG: hypothetical protein MRERC_9c019 [Mycoplasmataceae bacterium RC_NB112A]|nr:MAG: hypothetical protein MRERC_9c019 [Mycoplasmataceae bacterium RC_NB112A]